MAGTEADFEGLLAEARVGSAQALGQVLEACRGYLVLVAGRQLDPDLRAKGGASDLVQETFLEAHRDFGRFAGTGETELLAWLRQILLNNLANFTRRYLATDKRAVARETTLKSDHSSEARPEPAAPTPSPSGEAMAREEAQALQRALERLPEDYRRVVQLRYQEERSFEEIGQLIDRSPEAARKLWARAMERLRQEWEASP
jgi:RNA polymerase sigma-70 factor (ECF subfamily)